MQLGSSALGTAPLGGAVEVASGFRSWFARFANSLIRSGSMKKNVAGQKIGCQMVNATDGSAFTGSVTVYVTGDAGTQAAGSVGSGACTHEGNGYHTYAPAQAETNYDLVAFTFVGTGAIPATVQVYTGFPQSVDNDTKIAAIKAVTDELPGGGALTPLTDDLDDIQSRLPAALTGAGNMKVDVLAISGDTTAADNAESFFDGTGYAGTNNVIPTVTTVNGLAANVVNASALATDAVAEISAAVWSETTRILTAGTNIVLAKGVGVTGFNDLDAAGVRGAVGLAAANLDTQLSTIDTVVDAILVDTAEIGTAGAGLTALASAANLSVVASYLDTEIGAIKAKTDNLPASPAATSDIPSAASIADAVLDEALSGHTTSGSLGKAISDSDLRGSRTVIRGTVDSGASTTSIPTSAFSPAGASADQFKGRIVVFDNDTATAALRGEATDITASSNSATPTLTVTALSATPAAGDSFSVL